MTDQQRKAIAPSNFGSDRSHQSNSSSHHTRLSKFQYSGKGKPCPICNRTKDDDCRWNDEVVLCHTCVNQDAQVAGYVYRGANDIWGQYFPVDESTPKPIRPQARKEFIYKDVDGTPLEPIRKPMLFER